MAFDVCFVCDKEFHNNLENVTTVREKGLKTFIESSKKRKDGKHVKLCKISAVKVHEQCRKNYNSERMIASHLKRVNQCTEHVQRRSSEAHFSFKTHCFLCGLVITPEFSEEQRKKRCNPNVVYKVRVLNAKETITKRAEERGDEYGKSIIKRILPISDLVASSGQYHSLCLKKLYSRPKTQEKRKRGPFSNDVEEAMEDIYNYLENSYSECQFSLEELIGQIKSGYRPDNKTVKAHLNKKYGSSIIISNAPNKKTTVCFANTGYKILNDVWYQQASKNEQEERLRVVKTAAAIIVEDIRSQVYETEQYPPPNSFLEENEGLIPETLRTFMETVVLHKKRGDHDMWRRKSTALSHSILAAVRPRSFVSPLLVGLAVFLYKKYGSRKLVDMVSSLGFCSSYSEATRMEASAINSDSLKVNQPCFSQQVYDNADFNVHTIDGYNTFHVMGGISCISPKEAVVTNQSIPRLKIIGLPSPEIPGSFGALPVIHFERLKPEGLADIKILDLKGVYKQNESIVPSVSDLLWLYGKSKDIPGLKGWNGFMEDVTRDLLYERTFVMFQPFINAPPGNYDTILTALLTGVERTKSLNQVTCLITFDQPLYLKARDILASRPNDPALSNVVIRLGGFHLLMSFMGAIGYIMQGSGLTELFGTVFAANSTEKIMSGHAYTRAVRAHMLAHRALADTVIKSMNLPSEKEDYLKEILFNMDRTLILSSDLKETLKDLQEEFKAKLQQLAEQGPTAKLWVLYFEMVTLIKHFIEAERSGNWDLHLQTIYEMIPFFHASGHNHYAKCSHLYLQDMSTLKTSMPLTEYELFTTKGCFTVRRSDKLWCGTWSDMAIEQTLMKSMKTSGGLTHGRGVTAGVVTRWTQGMTALHNVCQEIEHFTGVELITSEQHCDSRDTMQNRDNNDTLKFLNWLHEHPPFQENTDLISLSTGAVADERINCHLSKEMGMKGIQRIVGSDFQNVKFKRSERVLPLAVMNSSIRIQDRDVVINPLTLFQRITIVKQSDEELREFLRYELTPYPLSLFDEHGMRKGTKSSLYKAFSSAEDIDLMGTKYVIDGGFLLHRVKWHHGQTYTDICKRYVLYVKSNYKSNAVVIFDGYPDEGCESTKQIERMRRAQRKQSNTVSFTKSMVPTVSQESFLSNSKNKNRLISMLMESFCEEEIDSQQALEDADVLIITTALELSTTNENVIVVGQDVDLLVILIGLCSPDTKNVFFLKPGSGKVPQTMYHPHLAIEKSVSDHILFLHAMSGCDTTSALFNQGKLKFFKVLNKNNDLQKIVSAFKDPHAHQDEIAQVGNQFLMALYSKKHETSLNDLRYSQYVSSAYKTKSNIASLPPTEAAARQHSLRVYFQVQKWLSSQTTNNQQQMDPNEWGWKKMSIGLVPVPTTLSPAPDSILRHISCKCKKGCQRSCGCRKTGLRCSPICMCGGLCENVDPPEDDVGIDEDESEERYGEHTGSTRLDCTENEQARTLTNDVSKRVPAEPAALQPSEPGPLKRQRFM